MDIKPFLPADIIELPFLQPEGWIITPAFEFYTASSFCFPVKIVIDDKIVGIGTTIIHNDVAWLAHIIVHPEHRNKGLGQLITKTLINSLEHTDCKTIYLIATDLGAPVYEKLGFKMETEYLFFKDIKTNQNPTSTQIIKYDELYKEQVSEIDRLVSGEDRMFHLEEHLGDAYLYVQDNIVEGYYLPTFGEGLIIANTTVAGLELMKVRLASKDNACIPVDNISAIDFLHRQGHKEFKSAKRMILGKHRDHILSRMYNRIAGSMG